MRIAGWRLYLVSLVVRIHLPRSATYAYAPTGWIPPVPVFRDTGATRQYMELAYVADQRPWHRSWVVAQNRVNRNQGSGDKPTGRLYKSIA